MLRRVRRSFFALCLAVGAWSAGCAITPRPVVDPTFAARTYTPVRIALLPPDVFTVLDQVGDNDAAKSEELRRQVFDQIVRLSTETFRQRGYDLDLSARWDGIAAPDGQVLVSGDELSWMANATLAFVNSPAGAQKEPWAAPQVVAPEMAAKIGWATNSDALLYVNLKGVTVSDGKRAAVIVGAVFIALLVVLIVLAAAKGNGGGHPGAHPGGGRVAGPAMRGSPRMGSAMAARPPIGPGPGRIGRPPVGRGPRWVVAGPPPVIFLPPPPVAVIVPVPLEGPAYTHQGQVTHEDGVFGDDQAYLTMTLMNAADGRVLWHLRQDFDIDVDDPKDVEELVRRVVETVPLRGDLNPAGVAPTQSAPPPGVPAAAPAQ